MRDDVQRRCNALCSHFDYKMTLLQKMERAETRTIVQITVRDFLSVLINLPVHYFKSLLIALDIYSKSTIANTYAPECSRFLESSCVTSVFKLTTSLYYNNSFN